MRLRVITSATVIVFALVLIGTMTDFSARDRSVPVSSWPRVQDCPPYPPAKTGQTECYDTVGSSIPCAGTGQDGEYKNGVVVNPRFRINLDGTVTDNRTGLIWLQNADCFGQRDWEGALSDANSLASGLCDLTDDSDEGDWRVPNVLELQSLLDYSHSAPALPDGFPFLSVQTDNYWSSSSLASFTGGAWYVNFSYGRTDSVVKTSARYVWPVRDSE